MLQKNSTILTIAERVVTTAIRNLLPPVPGKRDVYGGYLYVMSTEGIPLIMASIGYSSPKYVLGRIESAREQAQRLFILERQIASYDTRNPDREQWGGAVRGKDLILSFAGLPELWDEAVMFVTAIRLGQRPEAEVLAVIDELRNQWLRPLLEATQEIE